MIDQSTTRTRTGTEYYGTTTGSILL